MCLIFHAQMKDSIKLDIIWQIINPKNSGSVV